MLHLGLFNVRMYGMSIQRYYAKALMACLHRSVAVSEWSGLMKGENVSLERALGAFDLFIPESGCGNPDEVRRCLTTFFDMYV